MTLNLTHRGKLRPLAFLCELNRGQKEKEMKLSNDEMNALHLLFDEMKPQMAECFETSMAYGWI